MSFGVSTTYPSMMMSLIKEVKEPQSDVSNFWISDWLECFLRTTSLNNSPPTTCSRWCFILTTIIYNAYAYVTHKTPVDYQNPNGVNFWPSNERGQITVPMNVWMEYICQYTIPILLQTWLPYSISPHVSPNSGYHQLDASDPSSLQSLLISHGSLPVLDNVTKTSFSNFKQIIQAYFNARHQDGWLNTFNFNTSYNNNTNLSTPIDGNNTTTPQNLNTLNKPDNWTPIKITKNGVSSVKAYVTPEWGTANSGILSNNDRESIQSDAQQLFPDPNTKPAQWAQEIQNVLQTQSQLNDEQKMIAEYWLQCPSDNVNTNDVYLYGTPSPSGVWLAFADIYLRSNNKTIEDEIRYYVIISAGIFEASLNAWKLKRTNLQARPVQKIRQLLYNPSLSINEQIHQDWNPATPTVNGIPQTNSGAYWLPYQTLYTITPPFPDFVSGHSTFGAAASKLLNYLTGSDFVTLQNPVTNLLIFKYTSQLFYNNNAWKNASINNIFLYPGCSSIQASDPSESSNGYNGALQVPLSGIRLNWPTWSQMANSNGESRIYGGVHWESSNQAGLLVGNEVADALWLVYKNL